MSRRGSENFLFFYFGENVLQACAWFVGVCYLSLCFCIIISYASAALRRKETLLTGFSSSDDRVISLIFLIDFFNLVALL